MSPLRAAWTLDPDIVFLNHGSFGACPRAVQEAQGALRERMEANPVAFFTRELEPRIDAARAEVAEFVGARPEDLAFVRNATDGVNAVLASASLAPGDELLTTDHAYGACRNALAAFAERAGARVVVARVPFPLSGPGDIAEPVLAAVTARTRLALLDHVTSPTGVVFPVAELASSLAARGVRVLIDGAHAPGMLPLGLAALGDAGVDWYTGNLHKAVCAPKGAGFLWARRDRQAALHPTTVSHGRTSTRARPRLHEEFDWTGTDDPTPWLCAPVALRVMAALLPGGWPAILAANHELALRARELLTEALGAPRPTPDALVGSLVAVPLPPGSFTGPRFANAVDPLQAALAERHRIEVPVPLWPQPPARLVRVTAQLHVSLGDVARLARALTEELARERDARPAG
ncbi:MAG: aminotransferase class V-fold PLP-dependent enzyme [Polyangiaceae bacterium]|nr:aminotransferase class V-fold PLP-dependent enzyme [Polyangiaceae bacterium]